MKKYQIYIASLYIMLNLASPNHIFSHNEITVQGKILDINGKAVSGATVRVQNTVLGAVENSEGMFTISRLKPGNLNVLVTAIGYKAYTFNLNLNTDKRLIVINDIILEESPINTSDIIVTATRSEKIYEDLPVKVSVLDDRIFSSVSAVTLNEGLAFRPGLRIENNCQNCGFNQVRINGLDGRYSQILIDSKPIFSALNGVYGLEQIPQNMISRVEIIRGGASTLYGGNAIAGVVNIITKDPEKTSIHAELNQTYIPGSRSDQAFNGSDRTFKFAAQAVSHEDVFGINLHAMHRTREPWDVNNDSFSEIPSIDLIVIGSRMNYKPDIFTRLSLEYHNINDHRRGGNKFELQPHETDVTEMTEHKINSIGITAERYMTKSAKMSFYASYQNTHRNSYYGSEGDENAYGITQNRTFVSGLQYTHAIRRFAGEHVITSGIEYKTDNLNDFSPAYSREISQISNDIGFYIQNDWMINNKLSLLSGIRLDKSNFIDNVILSPRVNLLYKIHNNVSLRTNLSTGFRAPQVFDEDLHITQVNGGGTVIFNSDELKPEKSISYGISIDHNFNVSSIPASYSIEFFSTTLNNAFVLENTGTNDNGDMILIRTNAENAKVTGFTTEIAIEAWDYFNVSAGCTFQNSLYSEPVIWAENQDGNQAYSDRILRSPDFYGFFTMSTPLFKRFELSLSGVLTGPMHVPHYAGGIGANGEENVEDRLVRTPAFVDIYFKLSYRISSNPNLEIAFTAGNLLNSFQKDFDLGMNRDAGFIYGPIRPRHLGLSLNTGL